MKPEDTRRRRGNPTSGLSPPFSDRRVLKLLRHWLQAGVIEDGQVAATVAGTPQGGVISPLLSNIFLHVLDTVWTRRHAHLGVLVRRRRLCATTVAERRP